RNPRSGSGWRRSLTLELVNELKRLGFQPRLFRNRERLDAWMRIAENAARVRCLVAAGGDGTAADLFNRHPGVPLALLPVGTENLLARGLGIPASGRNVARIIALGNCRTLDLCALGSRRFALMASAGFDAQVIHRVHSGRIGHISHLAYFQPICESLRTYSHEPLSVWCDNDPTPVSTRQVVIVNFPMYALGLPMARRADPSDGLLDLRLFQGGSAFQMVRYFCNLALGRHEQLPDVVCRTARCVRIASRKPVPLQVDGDPAGTTPAEVCVLPGALQVFVSDTPR
ncbi:MAG: diacylglycerol kinase, partial [Planctomycetaceae bacterium]